VTEGDRKVVYYAKDNDLTKPFHSKICQLVEPVKAVGNVQEKDGKRHITLTYIEVKSIDPSLGSRCLGVAPPPGNGPGLASCWV